jgi:hypothetical protein
MAKTPVEVTGEPDAYGQGEMKVLLDPHVL